MWINNRWYEEDKDGNLVFTGIAYDVKLPEIKEEEKKIEYDAVNHPSHYTEGRQYEPIKVIQDWELDFCLGNTVKYISRAGRKSSAAISDIEKEIQDLEKARFYLNYRIKELEDSIS